MQKNKTNEDIKVSIIIPIYNIEKLLEKCLSSIISQTHCNLEILLVDDGSTDGSGTICDKYKEKDRRIIVIHKENGGLNSAVKAGLHQATADLIAFVDGDDWVTDNYIGVMLDAMVRDNADLVCANGYSDGKILHKINLHNCKPEKYEKNEILDVIFPNLLIGLDTYKKSILPSRCAKLFRKDALLNIEQFYLEHIHLGEDSLMTIPYILCADRITFIDDCIYYYRINPESISHRFNRKNLEDLICCVHQYEEMANKLSDFDFSKQIAAKRVEIIYRTLNDIVKNTDSQNTKAMFRYFRETINSFEKYPVVPYADIKRVKWKYLMIQRKNALGLWLVLNLQKLYHTKVKKQ